MHVCVPYAQDYTFQLEDRDDTPPQPDRARERYVGLTNRVISGLLIHQVRSRPSVGRSPTLRVHASAVLVQRLPHLVGDAPARVGRACCCILLS